jgi:hypothetical protein
MKKFLLLILVLSYTHIYAQDNEKKMFFEAWGDTGLAWEHDFIENNTLAPDEIPAKSLAGLNLNFYAFFNDNPIGFFQSAAFFVQLPLEKQSVYYPAFQGDYSLGVAYHYHIKNTLTLFLGIGGNVNFMQGLSWELNENGEIFEYNTSQIKFGGAFDAGIKFDINNRSYISFGSTVIYNFVIKETNVFYNYNGNDEWHQYRELNNNYGLLRIRPYIAYGRNFRGTAKGQITFLNYGEK